MNLMKKKIKIAIIICLSIGFSRCNDIVDYLDKSEEARVFSFKNYTEKTFENATIQLGEVIDKKIFIKHTKKVSNITAKKNTTAYTETKSESSVDWYYEYVRFLHSKNDLGCFIVTLSDGRKLYLAVPYSNDFPGGIANIPILFEITIKETEFSTPYKVTTLKGIPVDDFEIITK